MRGQALQLMSEEFREEGYRTGDAAGFQRGTLNHAKETVVRVYTQAKSLDNAVYYAGVSCHPSNYPRAVSSDYFTAVLPQYSLTFT